MYATEQMESYYSKVTIQVNELQEFHQDVEEGFEEILKTKKAGTVKEKKQSVLAYVEHLQERYRSINNIFFCSDYIVDGLLYDFKISRQKQQKKTDILFQNYDRGLIRQEDIVEILLSLMECGAQAEKISLHAAAMKNQLILCMTEQSLSKQLGQSDQEGGERDKKKRLKRRLKKYLKKYDGTFYSTDIQGDTQKIIIALRRN